MSVLSIITIIGYTLDILVIGIGIGKHISTCKNNRQSRPKITVIFVKK